MTAFKLTQETPEPVKNQTTRQPELSAPRFATDAPKPDREHELGEWEQTAGATCSVCRQRLSGELFRCNSQAIVCGVGCAETELARAIRKAEKESHGDSGHPIDYAARDFAYPETDCGPKYN